MVFIIFSLSLVFNKVSINNISCFYFIILYIYVARLSTFTRTRQHNIHIREIEDRLLYLAQTYFFRDMLVFETVNDQNWSANTSAFQIVFGADGAGSLTRQHVFGMSDMVTHGGRHGAWHCF